MGKTVMTMEGRLKMEQELKRLRGPETKEAIAALADAKSQGDLSENSEYDAAKEFYDQLNIKIQKLESILANCYVIDKSEVSTDNVQILTSVRVINQKTNTEKVFTIVPESDIDIKSNKISFNSPIGKSLIGKYVNDIVEVTVPSGKLEFKILEISI